MSDVERDATALPFESEQGLDAFAAEFATALRTNGQLARLFATARLAFRAAPAAPTEGPAVCPTCQGKRVTEYGAGLGMRPCPRCSLAEGTLEQEALRLLRLAHGQHDEEFYNLAWWKRQGSVFADFCATLSRSAPAVPTPPKS